jgi:cardiolipin synthase
LRTVCIHDQLHTAMPIWLWTILAADVLIRIVTVIYVPQRRSPAAARTWLLLILLVPVPGLIFYEVFGRFVLPRGRAALYLRFANQLKHAKRQWRDRADVSPATAAAYSTVADLAQALGDFPPQSGNQVTLLAQYEAALTCLVNDIDQARTHVHLLYYIFVPDAVGRRITLALVRAAQRGVACRVMMDSVGSKLGLRVLGPELVSAGIEVTEVLPVGLLRAKAGRLDLRNHRKMAVIDGLIAYIGSQNLINADNGKGLTNEELVVRLTGPVVGSLQVVFLADRYVELEHRIGTDDLFPAATARGSSMIQVLPSGPAYGHANFKLVAQALIHAARHRVFLTTPYFIPDEAFLECLQMAAARGVDVTLLVSRKSDNRMVSWAQQSFYEEVLAEGIKLYLYEPAFLHAKHLSVDDQVAVIGSSNLDIRSFWLNNEISVLIYDAAVATQLHAIEDAYLTHSTAISVEKWAQRNRVRQVIHNIARLADALL